MCFLLKTNKNKNKPPPQNIAFSGASVMNKEIFQFKTVIYIDDVNMLNAITTSISQKDSNTSLSFGTPFHLDVV